MPDDQLARFPIGHIIVVIVDRPGLEARDRPADGPGMDQPRLDVVGDETAGLAHRPEFHERKAEPFLAFGMLRGIDAGAETEPHLMLPLLRTRRQLEQHVRDYALIMHRGDAAVDEILPPGAAMEPVRKEQGSAGDEHAGHRNAEAVGVMQREWVVHTLLAFAQADGAAARRIPGTPSMEIL